MDENEEEKWMLSADAVAEANECFEKLLDTTSCGKDRTESRQSRALSLPDSRRVVSSQRNVGGVVILNGSVIGCIRARKL